jgi:site-specific recombinase XerD
MFKEWLLAAGLPPARFSLHHLLHAFATMLLNASECQTVDLKTLQDLLGHENLSTTGFFTYVSMHQKQRAVETLNTYTVALKQGYPILLSGGLFP